MSDLNEGSTPDPIQQLKAETNRKLENVTSTVSKLEQTNALLLEKLNALTAPARPVAPAAPEDDITSVWYSDPAKATALIREQTKAEIRAEIQAQNAAQSRTNAVFNELVTEFPELNDKNSELTKKAVEIYSTLSEEEKRSPLSYKLAAKEAAVELGVKPRSRRTEDFMEPSTSGATRRRRANKVPATTETWAKIFEIDTENTEVRSRLIKNSQRNWSEPASIPTKKGKK